MPRSLTNIDESNFQKAQNYLDKVVVVDSTQKRLKASIQGSARLPYQISLQKSELNQGIYGFCSCPAFITSSQCKHIAAVVLKGRGNFFDQWDSSYEFISDIFNKPSPITMEHKKQSDEFSELLDEYILEQKRESSSIETPEIFYADKSKNTNSIELIWYIIDFYEDYTGIKVEFSLQCQSRLASGRLGKVKNIKINPDLIRAIPNVLDQEILNILSAFGRWEYSQSKNASTFHNGSFYLHENRDLFIKIIKSNRCIKRTYSYYDVDEDKELTIAKEKINLRFQVNTQTKKIIPFFEFEEKSISFQEFDKEIYDQFILRYDRFYQLAKEDLIKNSLYKFILTCFEKDLLLTDEQWNELQSLMLKNIPHHMFCGDKFNLKVSEVDIYFELYLKWEEKTDFIRGFIYVPNELNDNSLVEIDYSRLENFFQKFKEFNFNENTFLFENTNLFELCQYANDLNIPIFFKKNKLKAASSFSMNVTGEINWLDLDPKLKFKKSDDIDFKSLIKKINLKSNTIELADGEVGVIPEQWLRKIQLIQRHAKVTKDAISLHPAKLLLMDEFPEIKLQKNIKQLKHKLENFTQIEPLEESSNFKGTLRPYQRLGLGWFDFIEKCHFGGCLADDMGLGKTIQVIAHLQKKYEKNKALKTLILCPKSLTGNWQSEFENFAPEISTFNWKTKKLTQEQYDSNDVFLVSYQLLQRQADFDFDFNYLFLDEAQIVKNATSLTHKAVALIKAKHKYALTGTPIENHAGDIMNIFNILIPNLFASKNIKDPSIIDSFNFLRPFLLRRTKDEVLSDLPQKSIQTILCEQSKKEKEMYLNYHLSLRKELESKSEEKFSKLIFLQVLTKLRQAASHLSLVDNANTIPSSKMETLKELVADIHQSGNKVIIFSQFTKLLKLVQAELSLTKENSSYLDGQTRNREEVISEFKQNKSLETFLISIKAGGVGLNLTNASYCIILDPWWNPAVEAQAIDRIHRIGQKNPVFAYRLITKDTIEQKVDKLQESKKALYDKVLASNEGFIKELKRNDIEFLLS